MRPNVTEQLAGITRILEDVVVPEEVVAEHVVRVVLGRVSEHRAAAQRGQAASGPGTVGAADDLILNARDPCRGQAHGKATAGRCRGQRGGHERKQDRGREQRPPEWGQKSQATFA